MELTAGGVVFRKKGDTVEVLLIDDRFGRVSLPKGHLENGETPRQAALREIEEETGIRGEIIGDPLGVVRFPFKRDGQQLEKEVTYYLVKAIEGEERPQIEEIRGINWYSIPEVMQVQQTKGYANNEGILKEALARLSAMEN